jgi:hypothetical protein
VEPQDPERRIAELERQLAEAQAAARQEELLGGSAYSGEAMQSSAAPYETQLAPAPRKVPVAFLFAEMLPFRWWYVWVLFMVAVAPIALWIPMPAAFAAVAILTLVAIYGVQLRGAKNRIALLKWGQVATIIGTETLSRGTYYSGTTWSNVYLPVAHGWTVTRQRWSGPSTKTRIRYTLGGYQGELVVRGREYIDGVVLADQRRPARALCVTSFAYDLDREAGGNWVGKLRPRLLVGMACWLVIVFGWVALAAIAAGVANVVAGGGGVSVPPGGKLSVGGNNVTKTIACNDGYLSVGGNANTITVTGHCVRLTVSGSDNHVTVDAADTITASGVSNQVTYHSGSPQINNAGVSTVVQQG